MVRLVSQLCCLLVSYTHGSCQVNSGLGSLGSKWDHLTGISQRRWVRLPLERCAYISICRFDGSIQDVIPVDQPLATNVPLEDGQVNVRCPFNLPGGQRYVVACESFLLVLVLVSISLPCQCSVTRTTSVAYSKSSIQLSKTSVRQVFSLPVSPRQEASPPPRLPARALSGRFLLPRLHPVVAVPRQISPVPPCLPLLRAFRQMAILVLGNLASV